MAHTVFNNVLHCKDVRVSDVHFALPSGWYRGFSTKKPSIKVIISEYTHFSFDIALIAAGDIQYSAFKLLASE